MVAPGFRPDFAILSKALRTFAFASIGPRVSSWGKCLRSVTAEPSPIRVAICSCVTPNPAIDFTFCRCSSVGATLRGIRGLLRIEKHESACVRARPWALLLVPLLLWFFAQRLPALVPEDRHLRVPARGRHLVRHVHHPQSRFRETSLEFPPKVLAQRLGRAQPDRFGDLLLSQAEGGHRPHQLAIFLLHTKARPRHR